MSASNLEHAIEVTRRGSSHPSVQSAAAINLLLFTSQHSAMAISRCFVFVVSILLVQLPGASAGCTNFTFLTYELDVPSGFLTRFKQKLDFVSCPSSSNRSCQILPRDYNITIPCQLNVSSHQSFVNLSFNDWGVHNIEWAENTSYVFNQSSDVSDSQSIFKFIDDYFARTTSLQMIQRPLSTTVSTLNISVVQPKLDLAVEMGHNMTLFFNPFMAYTWGTFDGCDNKTLNGFPIEVTTPYFTRFGLSNSNNSDTNTVLAGQFLVEEAYLHDSVPASSTKKSSGIALNIQAASTGALMASGVLGFMLL
jgi:Family of unknown function (DUF6060)